MKRTKAISAVAGVFCLLSTLAAGKANYGDIADAPQSRAATGTSRAHLKMM